jgi:hypothetical protein
MDARLPLLAASETTQPTCERLAIARAIVAVRIRHGSLAANTINPVPRPGRAQAAPPAMAAQKVQAAPSEGDQDRQASPEKPAASIPARSPASPLCLLRLALSLGY